jgi:hypothetical protein
MTQRVSRSLASAVVALTLLTGSGLASAQGMALQPIVARMLTAMSAATAYRIVVDSTISGGGTPRGGVARTHMEMIRVHHGTTTQVYVLMVTTPAKGAVSTSETVMSGTRGCTRQSRTGAWNCHYPPSAFAALTNADPAKALQEAGIRVVMTPTGGRRTIGGQPCAVYTFTESIASGVTLTVHGLWYLNATTTLPVEVDAVGSEALVQGQPPFAVKSTASYSRWNDPTLRVPAVPGM